MRINISSLEKAVESLAVALEAYGNSPYQEGSAERELMRDGVIQRFEYSFELSWKMLKRYLKEYSLERVDLLTNRDLFRVGYQQGMLRDAEAWLDFLEKRNLTSHTYDAATAEVVYQSARDFMRDARFLLERLREKV
jgi:nucleotidyltransferase substrate binding protein (TIGR01987 family)